MLRKGIWFLAAGLGVFLANTVLVETGVLVIGPCSGVGAILLMLAGCVLSAIGLALCGIAAFKRFRAAV
jgi:hypothetical protein